MQLLLLYIKIKLHVQKESFSIYWSSSSHGAMFIAFSFSISGLKALGTFN